MPPRAAVLAWARIALASRNYSIKKPKLMGFGCINLRLTYHSKMPSSARKNAYSLALSFKGLYLPDAPPWPASILV